MGILAYEFSDSQGLIYLNSFHSKGGNILQSGSEFDWELNTTSFSESGLILFISRHQLFIYGFFVMPILLTLSQSIFGEPCIWCDKGQLMNMGLLCWGNIILVFLSLYKPQFTIGLLLGSMFSWFYFLEYVWV